MLGLRSSGCSATSLSRQVLTGRRPLPARGARPTEVQRPAAGLARVTGLATRRRQAPRLTVSWRSRRCRPRCRWRGPARGACGDLVGGQRVAGARSVTDAAKTTPSTLPAGGDHRPAGVARPDQRAHREHLADHRAVPVDVGAAQPLLGADPRRPARRTARPAGSRAPQPPALGLAVAVEREVRPVEPVDGEHRDVEVGVVVDDRRRPPRGSPTRTVGLSHAGDDVGVGHHPARGVEEAGALDASAAAVLAADLEHARRGAPDVGVAGDPAGRRADLDDPLAARTARGSGGRSWSRPPR